MKYWIYAHMWTSQSGSQPNNNSRVSAFAGESILELYEHCYNQPEDWVLTSAHEITAEEYTKWTGEDASIWTKNS